eukprot:756355-Hanusia_phi.AAC.1
MRTWPVQASKRSGLQASPVGGVEEVDSTKMQHVSVGLHPSGSCKRGRRGLGKQRGARREHGQGTAAQAARERGMPLIPYTLASPGASSRVRSDL